MAQNQNSKWCFGNTLSLDFLNSPPSLSTSSMSAFLGSASVADAAGNLLFYTDGQTIFNQTHAIMANGTGLLGYNSIQSSLIVKQPGNTNIYYLFTTSPSTVYGGNGSGLCYSVVDMNLAAGMGSVTVKNMQLYQASTERLTGTRHCNGTDVWVLTHEVLTDVYRAHLLTSAGLNTVSINSAIGSAFYYSIDAMKISPNGRKVATHYFTSASPNNVLVELMDFDNSTGVVSNSLTLYYPNSAVASGSGCEFSPDGTKFYVTNWVSSPQAIYQWDLCAGSSSAIVASATVIGTYTPSSSSLLVSMQVGLDGKIYVAKANSQFLGVINNPNLIGTACNYVDNGLSVSPYTSSWGLPNFMSTIQKPPLPPIAYTVNTSPCQMTNFISPVSPGAAYGTCNMNSYTLQSLQWDFGDPPSLSTNTSTLSSPTHTFTSIGSYTVKLILNFGCGGGIDTLKQVININQSCFSVSTNSITCANLGSASVTPQGSGGPFTYSWLPTSQTSSVATNLIPGTYTLLVYDPGINYTHTLTQIFTPLIPLAGNLANSSSVSCNASSSGTAAITGINGGSSLQNFLWTNGTSNFTTSSTNSLSAGLWSVTVTDALTLCTFSNVFFITQPPAFILNLSSNTPTNCAGANIILTGTNSGGTPFSSGPPYTYTWSPGPANDTQTVTQSTSGTFVYTLNSTDANNCLTSNTIVVDFIPNPVLSTSNTFICPLAIGTITVSGATNYTWSSPSTTALSTGNSFTDVPLSTQQYTVTGESLGCSSQTMASIALYNLPNPISNNNSPRCNGDLLSLTGFGGVSYVWSGPNSFTSAVQTNSINPVSLANAGVYNLTVTAATGCTASISKTVVVNPTPTLSAMGSTVCTTQTLNLSASSFTSSTYLWSGPPNFTSTLQNPFISNPLVNNTGTYTVKVTSALGCTNIAIATASVALPPSLTAQLSSNTLCSQAFNGSPNTITLTAGGANTYTLVAVPDMFNANPGGPISPLSAIPPNTGIASATLSGSNGVCTVTTGLTFSIIPNPSITVSSPTPVICAGDTYTYTNNGASSYTWSSSTPGFTTYNNGGVAVSNPSINSVFSVFGGSLGCNSASKTSSITVNPLPVFSVSPGTPTICLNNKITLSINGNASSYTWSPYVGLNSNVGSTVSAFPTSLQTYTALGSLNSCTNTALITVSVLSLPSPTAIALKPELCLHELITLQGYGGLSYRWDGPVNLMYAGQTVTFVARSRAFSGTYTLTVTDVNGCMASNQVGVKINPLPNADLGISKQNGCVPFTSQFQMYTKSAKDTNIIAYWQLENQTFYSKQFSYPFTTAKTYSIFGYYSDTVTSCKNSATYIVEGYPLPIADFIFDPEKPVEGLDEVYFMNTSSGDELKKFNWYFINNKGYQSENKNTSYLFNEVGQYPIAMVVQNKWGCADTLVKSIKVESDYNLYVPNAFTPNEDNLNDVFLPILRGVKLYELMIFDRWGKRIFLSNQIESGWDGYYNGEPAKNDVYTWKINLSTNSGEAKVFTGQVLLSR
jgi:gliding motility-associated-like protein